MVTPYGDMIRVNNGSGNGLLPGGTIPLPEPVFICSIYTWYEFENDKFKDYNCVFQGSMHRSIDYLCNETTLGTSQTYVQVIWFLDNHGISSSYLCIGWHNKVPHKIAYRFPNFSSATIEVWEWKSNQNSYLLAMWSLIHAEMKSIHVSKRERNHSMTYLVVNLYCPEPGSQSD